MDSYTFARRYCDERWTVIRLHGDIVMKDGQLYVCTEVDD